MASSLTNNDSFFAALSPAWARIVNDTMERGEGVYLYATSGKRYLDFTSGIGVTNTGHCHPMVVAAIREQAERLLFGQMNCVVPATALQLVESLLPLMPAGLDSFFFSNSGAEAVEGAIKLARLATGRPNVIAFQGGFHGRTSLAMALTTSKTVYRAGYQPLPAGIFIAPFPYSLRFGGDEELAVSTCLRELELVLASQTAPSETAAMIIEPVLGEGGYVVAPQAFLVGLRKICDQHGILLIIDEIQTGFGRTGRWWAHEYADIRPDILVLAKGIASGLPLSAIVASRELMKRWLPGTHGGTYGGGTALSHVAAIATIRVITEAGLIENTRQQGEYLLARLHNLRQADSRIQEVRGLGLMVACEFEPTGEGKFLAGKLSKACAERGLLLLTCGTWGNVIRWVPPLIVTREQIDEGLHIFSETLRDFQ